MTKDRINNASQVLHEYTTLNWDELLTFYNEKHRFYHTSEHIFKLLTMKEMSYYSDSLVLAILFHDIVYDLDNMLQNEEKSFLKFMEYKKSNVSEDMIQEIKYLILSTHDITVSTPLNDLDLAILKSQNFDELMKWEHAIFKEFQVFNIDFYIERRVDFLNKAFQITGNSYLKILIDYVQNRKYNIGFFSGTFNPFHVGHYDILTRAENIFDKVIVAYGYNRNKSKSEIKIPETIKNREIIHFQGSLYQAIDKISCKENIKLTLVRGVRNGKDLEYENKLERYFQDFDKNKKYDFIKLSTNPEFFHISSSDLRSAKEFPEIYNKYVIK